MVFKPLAALPYPLCSVSLQLWLTVFIQSDSVPKTEMLSKRGVAAGLQSAATPEFRNHTTWQSSTNAGLLAALRQSIVKSIPEGSTGESIVKAER